MKHKITISEVTEKEVPITDFRNMHEKDEKGEEIWKNVETGEIKIVRDERVVFEQELEDLVVSNLATYLNERAK